MKRVNSGEARLLRTIMAVLRPALTGELRLLVTPPAARVSPRSRASGKRKLRAAYERIGPTAMQLVRSTLSRGVVAALVRHGGWRVRPMLAPDGETVVRGRLWQHAPDLRLEFSPASYQLARWLCGVPVALSPTTLGDEIWFRIAADAVARCGFDPSPLLVSPLAALGHAGELARDPAALDWSNVTSPDGLLVLGGLSDELSDRWAAMERAKGGIEDPERLATYSQRQAAVLDAFLRAIDAVGRRDLATFLVSAAGSLLRRPARAWIAGLSSRSPLSARSVAAREAAGFLGHVERIGRWHEELATVPFFEPEYHRAQLTLAEWEPLGRAGFAHVQALAEQLRSGRELIAESGAS